MLRGAREDAAMLVENALFKRAIGFQSKETTRERKFDEELGRFKIVTTKVVYKQIAGDVGAQQYWLEHRAPTRWEKTPTIALDIMKINESITNLANLVGNPVVVREIGSELIDD